MAATTDMPCPPWRRLLALVYDLLIVVAIVMVVGLACQLATHGQLIRTDGETSIPVWYQCLQALVVAAYFVSSWRRGGQTVGMRPWRIRVTTLLGSRLSMRQALIRVIVAALPLLALALDPLLGLHMTLWVLLGLWVVWFGVTLFDPRRRALHDLAAGTEIRRID